MLGKENAALLPLFLFLIEWVFFRFDALRARDGRALRMFWLIGAVTASVPILYYLARHGWLAGGYGRRSFTLEERLLTECRVLVFYLKSILLPRGAGLSLFHDDFQVSTGLLTPWTTLPSVLLVALLPVAAVATRKRAPVFAFGVLFFLVGHSLESSVIALELIHEHRNYLPGVGVLLVVFYYLAVAAALLPAETKKLPTTAIAGIAAVLVAHSAFVTATRARTWESALDLAAMGTAYHPMSSRWHYELGNAYFMAALGNRSLKHEFLKSARVEYAKAADLSPYYRAGDLLAVLSVDTELERPPDPALLKEITHALRHQRVSALTAVMTEKTLLKFAKTQVKVDPAVPLALLDAIKANPTLGSRDKGKILAAAGQLAINKMGAKQAVDFGIEALAAYPSEPQHYRNLALVSLERGNKAAAKELLDAGELVAAKGVAPNRAEIKRLSKLAASQ